MRKRPEPKTHCKHGHEFTPENTLLQRNGTHRVCRMCKREQEKIRGPKYAKTHKAQASIRIRRYQKNNPEKFARSQKRQAVKRDFGITLEEYESRFNSQKNLCGLCGVPFEGKVRTSLFPVLDHCHISGDLRQFIHNRCNLAIGQFRDDLVLLRLAVAYLEKHQGENLCTSQHEPLVKSLAAPL